jgi:hypothetical protein
MTYQEEFIAWRDANPQASEDEQRAKLQEVKETYEGGRRNIQRAKEMFPENKLIPAMEQGPEKFREELNYQNIPQTTRSMYPRVSRSMASGEMFNPVAGITDVSSGLGRLAESASYKALGGEQPFSERMENTGDDMSLTSSMLRDPMVPFSMGIGGATASGAGTGILRKGLDYLGRTTGLEAGQALGSQAEQMSRGEDFSAGELIGETALSTALPFGVKASKEAVGGVKEFAKDLISESTNRTRELLDIIGARELKQSIKHKMKKAGQKVEPDKVLEKYSSFAENAEKTAEGIIKTVDDLDVRFAEKNAVVKEAIRNMEPVDPTQFLNTLQNSKYLVPKGAEVNYPDEVKFNKMVDAYMFKVNERVKHHNPEMLIETLQETASGAPKYNFMTGRQGTKEVATRGTTIPASEIYELRKEIDRSIDWNANDFSKAYYSPIQKFKKDARTYLKNTLEEKASKMGNKVYAKTMGSYHKLLGMQEKAKKLLLPRVEDLGESDRSQKFLLQASNPNQLAKRKWAKEFQAATGYDLLADADLLRMSREYRGTLPMVNDYRTGAKNFAANLVNIPIVGGAVGLAVGSPRVGAAMYGAMDAGEKMYGEGLDKLSKYAPSLRTTKRSAIQQGIGE